MKPCELCAKFPGAYLCIDDIGREFRTCQFCRFPRKKDLDRGGISDNVVPPVRVGEMVSGDKNDAVLVIVRGPPGDQETGGEWKLRQPGIRRS